MLLDKSIPKSDGKDILDNVKQMELILDAVHEKERILAKGDPEKFPFGLKIVYSTPRSIPKEKMKEELQHCIELKIRFPDLICGRCPLIVSARLTF